LVIGRRPMRFGGRLTSGADASAPQYVEYKLGTFARSFGEALDAV
jgi:hypothetical protein